MPRRPELGGVPPPARWLVENADLLPGGGRALDVAAGRGRHSLWLAARGFAVDAVDRDEAALADIEAAARAAGRVVSTRVQDLEAPLTPADAPPARMEGRRLSFVQDAGAYDVVLVFNYLHRPLMPAIREAVAPGGVLFFETFLVGQAERGHPKNPTFLLRPGELAALVSPLTILRSREGEVDGNLVSSIVARRGRG